MALYGDAGNCRQVLDTRYTGSVLLVTFLDVCSQQRAFLIYANTKRFRLVGHNLFLRKFATKRTNISSWP